MVRAAKRHKARDKALPVSQRPVKWLWLLTAVFSGNFLLSLCSAWMHRCSADLSVGTHFSGAGGEPEGEGAAEGDTGVGWRRRLAAPAPR